MSRSFRKSPVLAFTNCSSDKCDKQMAQRRYRRAARISLERGDEVLPVLREKSDIWAMGKDGKRYLLDYQKSWLRK